MSVKQLEAILDKTEEEIDYATVKLTIDKIIDPTINIDKNLKQLDSMAKDVRSMLESPLPSEMKLKEALRRYLYIKGPWNKYQAYQYDFDDPQGTKISNKLIANYIESRRGNCISMPLLFLILGDKLGLDVKASSAPLHLFIKFTDHSAGITYNLETTDGALPTSDNAYRKQMYMTDQAIQNGVYMQPLSKKEAVAVMAMTLTEHYLQEHQYEEAIELTNVVLKQYPKYALAMLKKATAFSGLMKRNGLWQYRRPEEVPIEKRDYFKFLTYNTNILWEQALKLGWREQPKEYEDRYVTKVRKKKQ